MPNIGPPELVIIGVIALLFVWALVRTSRGGAQAPVSWPKPPDPALTALRERYARGEIDAAEFEERKRTLGG
jgi:putative membrane protein